MSRLISYSAFVILVLLWSGFLVAIFLNPASLDQVWLAFREMPLLVQVIVGLLILPVILGLGIWETTVPLWLRVIVVIGLAWATVYMFLPWKNQSADSGSKVPPT